jgi:hypothetical protein
MRPCPCSAVLLSSILVVAVAACAGAAEPEKLEVRRANGRIELSDPAGDVEPIHGSSGDYPGLDVVHLTIASDGKEISFAATLKDPPGSFANEVVVAYFDTDNKQETGMQMTFPALGGFEYRAKLEACGDYGDKSSACVGGSTKAKLTRHWAGIDIERYKGKSEYGDKDTVVDSMAFPGSKASAQVPIPGNVVQGAIDYADLKVKPGQTVRILVREASAGSNLSSYFPEVLLTLK